MAINKKLICFSSKELFTGANGLNGAKTPTNGLYGNIPETSIVFIVDSGEIWTHGQYFGINQYLKYMNYEEKLLGVDQEGNLKPVTLSLWGNVADSIYTTIDDSIKIMDTAAHVTFANSNLTSNPGWIIGYNTASQTNNFVINYSSSTSSYVKQENGTEKYIDTSVSNGNLAGNARVTITSSGLVTFNNGGLLLSSSSTLNSVESVAVYASTGAIIANNSYLRGKYLYNTFTTIDTGTGDGKAWSLLKKYSYNATTCANDLIDTYNANHDLAYIVQNTLAPSSNLQPWIAGSNSDYSGWSIGIGGTNVYVTRVASDNTTNDPSLLWKFKANGDFEASNGYMQASGFKATGYTSGDNIGYLMSDGTVSKPFTWTPTSHSGITLTRQWQEIPAIGYSSILNNKGTYLIQIEWGDVIYTGVFPYKETYIDLATYVDDGACPVINTNEEIVLTACGNSPTNKGRLYLKLAPGTRKKDVTISGVTKGMVMQPSLFIAVSNVRATENESLTFKFRRLL